jgi:hypothetical protein
MISTSLSNLTPADSAIDGMLPFDVSTPMADHSQTTTDSADPDMQVTFVGFAISLAHTAAVHLGDVPDPVSGRQMPPNLAAAQQMIDILALLEEKTRGNLSAEERQLLDQVLYELRMRYAEVAQSAPAGPEPSRIIIP